MRSCMEVGMFVCCFGVTPIFILNMRRTAINSLINLGRVNVYLPLNTPTNLISTSEEELYELLLEARAGGKWIVGI